MKSKLLLSSIAVILLFITQSCHLQFGTLVFDQQNSEIISSEELIQFVKNKEHPTIVLRTPVSRDSTAAETNAYYNYLIEKELVKSGFKVKDVDLFNGLVDKTSMDDYKNLKDITGVDLVLELIKIKKDIPYTTDKFYTKNGEIRELNDYVISRFGAIIEYKIIMVGSNESVGLYTFYYSPCSSDSNIGDCNCILGYKNGMNKIYPKKNWCHSRENPEFMPMDESLMEDFFIQSVRSMISDMKGK